MEDIEKECEKCIEIKTEVNDLRLELTKIRDKYSQICERLWTITNKKRF